MKVIPVNLVSSDSENFNNFNYFLAFQVKQTLETLDCRQQFVGLGFNKNFGLHCIFGILKYFF